jgi:uncharacterized protein YggE
MRRPAFLVVLASLFAINTLRADEGKERMITTSGESVVYVEPDEVNLDFAVETRDQSLDKAESLNNEAAAKLVAAVKKLGVEDRHIQTDHLNVQILYHDHNDLVISGYSASRGYSVTLKDPKQFEALVDTVLKNGANRINNFEFRTKELRKFRDQARAMAIKAAHEKAEALAGELKCKVGNPRTISEGGGSAGYWGGSRFNSFNSMAQNSAQYIPSGGEGDDGGRLPLGQIGVRASVSVTFDLIVPQ